MDLLKIINEAWAWRGFEAVELVDANAFGNVIVRTRSGEFWRIYPDMPDAEVIASEPAVYERLKTDPEFAFDWTMDRLIERARAVLGPVGPGRAYCLKMPALLGGAYDDDRNLGAAPLHELMAFAGDLARQIDELPDGAQVVLRVVD